MASDIASQRIKSFFYHARFEIRRRRVHAINMAAMSQAAINQA
jgi:hypothetical protein